MITIQDRQAFADISIIIKMMPKNMQQKIHTDFINLIEKYKDTNYISKINSNVPLKNQQLSETTEAILALIYRDYLCSPDERNILLQKELQELDTIEYEKKKKYEIDFKKNNSQKDIKIQDTALIEYKKESIFSKIINKIKHFLKFTK